MTKVSVVCGLHRSGTTYVGKILSLAKRTAVLQEPFNYKFGVAGVREWYPFLSANSSVDYSSDQGNQKLLDEMMSFSSKWKNCTFNKKGLFASVYRVTGGRKQLPWNWLKLRHRFGVLPNHIIWKDPFCTFMLPALIERELSVVMMVKHPCSFYYSVTRQSWGFSLRDFDKDGCLRKYLGIVIPENIWNTDSQELVLAVLWKLMMRMLLKHKENEYVLVIKHEDLCLQPLREAKKIVSHVGCIYSKKIEEFVIESSKGSSVAPDVVHEFKRNSRDLAFSWESKVPAGIQKEIMKIVQDEYNQFYGCSF